MDTPKPASDLPSIRTFARDLAKSQNPSPADAKSGNSASRAASKPVIEPTIAGVGESRKYQAPSAKNVPAPEPQKPVPAPVVVADTPKPVPKPAIKPKVFETGLKPLSAPKSVSSATIVVDNEDAASATIIRDTKHNRFRLFPAIGTSISGWFKEMKERYFTKKAPKYTVPDTNTRQGVIQKATSKTGKIATFDHTSLHERIRERENRALPKNPTTTWTANTEPGFPLLDAPEEPVVSNVQILPRKSYRVEAPVVPAPVVPPVIEVGETETTEEPVSGFDQARENTEVPSPAPVITRVEPALPTPIPPKPAQNEPLPEPEPEPIAPTPAPQPVAAREEHGGAVRAWLFNVNTNLISLGVASFVLFVGAISIVGFFWFKATLHTIDIVTLPNHQTYLEAPLQLLSVPSLTRDAMWSEIIENQNQSNLDLLLLALATSPSGEALLPVPAVAAGLNLKTSSHFTRSLDALYFGSYKKSTPFIFLKVTDASTALGGMLDWEQDMYTDLKPMLKTESRSVASGATFTDVIVDGVDARALVDTAGQVVLMYNLPKHNAIIITTSKEALQEILTTVK
jgi:hypothetical protein